MQAPESKNPGFLLVSYNMDHIQSNLLIYTLIFKVSKFESDATNIVGYVIGGLLVATTAGIAIYEFVIQMRRIKALKNRKNTKHDVVFSK